MTKISFIGDISLNGEYSNLYDNNINPFEEVSRDLIKSDYVVGNLECFAESTQGENKLKKPRLKTDLKTLGYLKNLNLSLACLANNHTYDNLLDGFNKTTNFLKENHIEFIGAKNCDTDSEDVLIKELNGIKFCFLNYVTTDTNPKLPSDAEVNLNTFVLEKVKSDIKKCKPEVDQCVVLLHWGGRLEGGVYPDYDQPSTAHEMIDAGADLIIGHHSHTLQPFEIYNNKYIFYSLGNFCFSDFQFEDRFIEIDKSKGTETAIIEVSFNKENYDVNILPYKSYDLYLHSEPSLSTKLNRRSIIWKKFVSKKFIWGLYFKKFKFIDPVLFFFWGNDRKFFSQLRKIKFSKILNFVKS